MLISFQQNRVAKPCLARPRNKRKDKGRANPLTNRSRQDIGDEAPLSREAEYDQPKPTNRTLRLRKTYAGSRDAEQLAPG
jgi:hypothetical protein